MGHPTAKADMITLARESRGLTQVQLSRDIGVTQGLLSKVENGQVEATDELVEKLSSRLKYPASFFSGSDISLQNLPLTLFRRRKSLAKKVLKQVSANVNVTRLHTHRLLKSIEIPEDSIPRWRLSDGGSPESVASDIRLHWNIPPGPIQNLTQLLEQHGVLVLHTDFGTAKIDGLSLFGRSDALPPMVFLNKNLSGDRQRWTLAHEFGHLVLHLHLDLPGLETEEEANRFASEFLMPAKDIRGHLGKLTIAKLASLKKHWKVSMQALIMRASACGKLTDGQKRYLFIKMSQLGYRTSEPVVIEPEEPTVYQSMIEAHFQDLGYTESELGSALAADPDDLRARYRYKAPGLGLRLVQ